MKKENTERIVQVKINIGMTEDLRDRLDKKIKEVYGQLVDRNPAIRDIIEQWIKKNNGGRNQ